MTTARVFPHRHLLGIHHLDADDIVQLLDLSDSFLEVGTRPIKKVPTLRGRTVINLFFENSTRTRTSFELAAKRLSADAVNITSASSSTTKGETLIDTVKNLQAMGPDAIVVRHAFGGAAELIAKHIDAAVINAGDGQHEHPTQALLDAATIRRHKGRTNKQQPLDGLEVAIVGDLAHSRVARSNIFALTRLGANLRLCAPHTLIPRGIERLDGDASAKKVHVCTQLRDALEGADVVMMLRVQSERTVGEAPRFPNTREFSRQYGLSKKTLAWAKPDAIVLHPGPINRGVELAPDVADGTQSVILEQVNWGVAVRMAVLYLLAGGRAEADA